SFPRQLAADLRDRLEIRRAVETGTYTGATARLLGGMFDSVVTIERSDDYFQRASAVLGAMPNVRQIHGHSGEALATVAPGADGPTLYWLDAHWSGGDTAGSDDPVPLMRELDAIGDGHPGDCILIDDARDFATSPDPRWPLLVEILDKVREQRPGDHVTVIHDLIISVPQGAKDIVDEFGRAHIWTVFEAGEKARGVRPPSKFAERIHPFRAWVGRKLGR
ncbi:MAG: hypothetical protein QOH95_2518, partial [Gaiellaceae bacterium]|nr:hypothetical protein [Gaiellaceae bacterium]